MYVYSTFAGKNQEDWLHAEDSLKEGIHFYVKVCEALRLVLVYELKIILSFWNRSVELENSGTNFKFPVIPQRAVALAKA